MALMALGNITKATATNTTTTVTGAGIILWIWMSAWSSGKKTTITVDGNTIYPAKDVGAADRILTYSDATTSGFDMSAPAASVPTVSIYIPFKTSFSIVSDSAGNTINALYTTY